MDENEQLRLKALTKYERKAQRLGFKVIAGVDEVGRGPLAGPIVAVACIIKKGLFFPKINDSKRLSASVRQQLFEQLTNHPDVHYAIGSLDPLSIDQLNIFQANLEAMRQAVANLSLKPDYLLVDGKHPFLHDIPTQTIVKGDALSQSIAAASIIAKQIRDKIMIDYHELYPQYGFADHKGYGTAKHLAALAQHGACPIHRKSFLKMNSNREGTS